MSNANPNKKSELSKDQCKAAIAASLAKGAGKVATTPGSREARKEEATAPGVVKPSKPERLAKIPAEKNLTKPTGIPVVSVEADVKAGADRELDAGVSPKKPREPRDPNMLTVGDVARELGVDPKRARARLRSAGEKAVEGRWPKVRRDSEEHKRLIGVLSAGDDKKPTT